MKKYVKTALWALCGLTITNYGNDWVSILLGVVCIINGFKNVKDIIQEA
jgi:hypothetical protein